ATADFAAEAVNEAYDLERPTPETAVVPAGRLWDAVSTAAGRAVANAAGQAIAGVGVSCMTPALILLDAADQPLTPVWTHFDRRSRPIARQIAGDPKLLDEFLNHACNPPLPGGLSAFSAAQQLHEEPGLRGRVRHYLHANGWLGLRLSGERAIDPAGACFTGLYEPRHTKTWSKPWCDYFDLDIAWLPKVVDGATTLGGLRPEVAAIWGVPAGIPVKLGTADTSSAMLAAGMKPGDLLHVVGTTQVLAAFADPPRPNARRLVRPLGVGDAFIHVTHNPVGGAALDWLFDLCYLGPADSEEVRHTAKKEFYDQIVLGSALNHHTKVELNPLFLGGDRLEIEEKTAAFHHLTLDTRLPDLVAAVLAGMRKGHTEALANLGLGASWRRIFLTGGGADVVRRLQLAEYVGAELHPLREGSVRGVARLF
ncbi:MAG: FGGY-family carbohydrate kinase, partial [Gemmataceae bacterium]